MDPSLAKYFFLLSRYKCEENVCPNEFSKTKKAAESLMNQGLNVLMNVIKSFLVMTYLDPKVSSKIRRSTYTQQVFSTYYLRKAVSQIKYRTVNFGFSSDFDCTYQIKEKVSCFISVNAAEEEVNDKELSDTLKAVHFTLNVWFLRAGSVLKRFGIVYNLLPESRYFQGQIKVFTEFTKKIVGKKHREYSGLLLCLYSLSRTLKQSKKADQSYHIPTPITAFLFCHNSGEH